MDGFEVGSQVTGEMGVAPLVAQMDGLGIQFVNVDVEQDVILALLFQHISVNDSLQVVVVNADLSMNIRRAVQTVQLNVLIPIAIIVDVVDYAFGLDGRLSYCRQLSAQLYVGGQLSEMVVVQQSFQVKVGRVYASFEVTQTIHGQLQIDHAGICLQLVGGSQLAGTVSAGSTF